MLFESGGEIEALASDNSASNNQSVTYIFIPLRHSFHREGLYRFCPSFTSYFIPDLGFRHQTSVTEEINAAQAATSSG